MGTELTQVGPALPFFFPPPHTPKILPLSLFFFSPTPFSAKPREQRGGKSGRCCPCPFPPSLPTPGITCALPAAPGTGDDDDEDDDGDDGLGGHTRGGGVRVVTPPGMGRKGGAPWLRCWGYFLVGLGRGPGEFWDPPCGVRALPSWEMPGIVRGAVPGGDRDRGGVLALPVTPPAPRVGGAVLPLGDI